MYHYITAFYIETKLLYLGDHTHSCTFTRADSDLKNHRQGKPSQFQKPLPATLFRAMINALGKKGKARTIIRKTGRHFFFICLRGGPKRNKLFRLLALLVILLRNQAATRGKHTRRRRRLASQQSEVKRRARKKAIRKSKQSLSRSRRPIKKG